MDKSTIINYFKAQAINGEWASLYDVNNPISYSFIQRFIKTVQLMKPIQGNILDMGCGTGILVQVVMEHQAKYVGFDAAEEMIEACNKQFHKEISSGKATFICADSSEFNSNELFDSAIGMGYLEYFNKPEVCIHEASSKLKKGGKLILSFPHKYSLDNLGLLVMLPIRKLLSLITGKRTLQPPRKYWGKNEAIMLFKQCGMEVQDVVFYNTGFFHYPFTKVFPRVANFVAARLEYTWLNKIPFFSTGFIICAIKK